MKVGELLCSIQNATHLNTEIAKRVAIRKHSICCQTLMYARRDVIHCTFPSRITIPRQVKVNLFTKL